MTTRQTPGHIAANNERMARKYDRITILVYKGEKEKVKKAAEENNESVGGFINRLIAENVDGFIPIDTENQNGRN